MNEKEKIFFRLFLFLCWRGEERETLACVSSVICIRRDFVKWKTFEQM